MITVIGDLTVDILVNKDETNYATDTEGEITFRPGGQANNVAAWIAHGNVPCQLIGRVGNDPFGTYLLDLLNERGIKANITTDPSEQTGKIVILIDEKTKNRSMITDRGANLKLSKSHITDVEKSKFLYLSGYSLFEKNIKDAIQYAKEIAVSHGIPIAIDPSSTYFLKKHKAEFLQFLESISFIFPNYDEGKFLTGEKEPEKIIAALKDIVPHPILKLGEEGCLLYDENNHLVHLPAKNVKAVDTTGAGDSFIGTFLANYVKTNDKVFSAKKATENAAIAVGKIGAWP